VDPLAGSYYVEHLTDEVETGARRLIDQVEALGGSAAAIEAGYFQKAIGESAWRQQQAQERGAQVVVGVNRFTDDSPVPVVSAPDYSELARQQVARLNAIRRARDGSRVRATLARLADAARAGTAPLMPAILDAVRARATLGEISDGLRREWGEYRAAHGA
jgi:methylmalonyl-CoA mutase N-terminal domain/subunit